MITTVHDFGSFLFTLKKESMGKALIKTEIAESLGRKFQESKFNCAVSLTSMMKSRKFTPFQIRIYLIFEKGDF